MTSKSISAIDIFCGVGGLTHGLKQSGIKVLAGVDIDESCRYAYEHNNGARFIHQDIKELTIGEIQKIYGKSKIKVLVGCAPCQPFSKHTNKNKNRRNDEKWRLLYYFSKLISNVIPDIVSMENVVELSKEKVFSDFLETLRSLGYHVAWEPAYCPDYGIPQTRTRLVLLASRLGKIELIPPTHAPREYLTVRDAIAKLEPIGGGECSETDPLHRSSKLSDLNMKRIIQSKPGGSWRDWDKRLISRCHRKTSGSTYGSVYARMRWDKPAPTITTQFYNFGTGRYGHPEQNRALSLKEGALLQTFPESYVFEEPGKPTSFKRVGVHIGNAVPVKLGAIIGRSILKHIQEKWTRNIQ